MYKNGTIYSKSYYAKTIADHIGIYEYILMKRILIVNF